MPPTVLHEILDNLQVERGVQSLTELTKNLHIYPDFHGEWVICQSNEYNIRFQEIDLPLEIQECAEP